MSQSTPSYQTPPTQRQVQDFVKDFVDNANQYMTIMSLEQLQRLHEVLEKAERRIS